MVGLNGAAGDDGVCAMVNRIGNAELEFPGFIAASRSRKHIIPFDVQVDPCPQCIAEGWHGLNGGWSLKILSTGKFGKIHRLSFP